MIRYIVLQCFTIITGTRDRFSITQKEDAFTIPADVLIMPKMYRTLKNKYLTKSIFFAVLRIRICRIRMVLGLPDPYPDSLVQGTDPDPSTIKQKYQENPDSYCFVASL